MEAIDVGSRWELVDEPNRFEVTNIYIDEDGIAQLKLDYERADKKVSVDSEDLREMMEDGKVERINSAHEAWKRRH